MAENSPASEIRHKLADRLFHWSMAICVVGLGVTAFLPIIGIKFEWVPWHWVLGVLLTVAILFHIYRGLFVHGLGNMIPRGDDVKEMAKAVTGGTTAGLAAAKYDVLQKTYHWTVAVTVLASLVTGLLMLVKIDTVFWKRNPALLSDPTWGWVYVIHGASAMLLLFLFILHLYFNFRPEHRDLLTAMLRGPGPANARKG